MMWAALCALVALATVFFILRPLFQIERATFDEPRDTLS